MKKILPVEYPPITSYGSIAHLLSALWPLGDTMMPWFCQQYIQLVFTKNYGSFYDCMSDIMIPSHVFCPFYEYQLLDKRQLYNYPENFSDFVEFHLLNDSYVVFGIDEYFVESSYNYQKNHYIHQAFFYGCDTKERKFYLSDFFGDKYKQTEVSYEMIDQGDRAISTDLNKWFHEVTIFKYKERHEAFKLDVPLIKILLDDYIHSKDSFHKLNFTSFEYGSSYGYGLQYYDMLIDMITDRQDTVDVRPFHVLYDHKVAMLIRLDYLYKQGRLNQSDYDRLQQELTQLRKENLSLRQTVLRCNIRPDDVFFQKLIQKCQELKAKEYATFSFMKEALH